MSISRAGQIALITGASSGIGRAAAISLYRAGWTVIVTARRQDALEETISLMTSESTSSPAEKSVGHSRASLIVADLGQPTDIVRLFGEVKEKFGRLDMLFNNAGIPSPKAAIEDIDVEVFKKILDVNVTAVFLCAQEAIKIMKSQQPRGGRIINNGSISAYTPRPLAAPYTISKHAVLGLTKSIALEGREHDIACSQLDIGNARTPLNANKSSGALQANGETMVEAYMDVSWVGESVAYMAGLPLGVNVLNQTLMATNMPFVGRG